MYPSDRLYSTDHEWIHIEDDICTLGITEYAQEELGEVVFVDLPEVGQMYDSGEELGTIESVKAVAEVYTPVSGRVVEVNDALDGEPELVNEDPHERAWLVKLKLEGDAETGELMSAEDYQKFIEGEGT